MGSVEEDAKMVETLCHSECYPHDLALFCFRMDGTRFPTRVHIDMIKNSQKYLERNSGSILSLFSLLLTMLPILMKNLKISFHIDLGT